MISSIINKILGKIMSAILNFVFNYIVSPIFSIITGVITAMVSWYFYEISVFLLTVVDFLFDMFQMLAGLKSGLVFTGLTDLVSGEVYGMDNAKDQDILIQLFTSEELFTVFIGMITVGIFLLFIFTIAKIIKVEFTTQGSQNAKGPILKKFLRALFNMLFTPVICIFGIVLSNEMLQLISTAFLGNSEDLTLSGVVFTSGCYNAVYSEGELQVDLTTPITSSITGGINVAMRLFNEAMKSIKADFKLEFDLGDVLSPNYITKFEPGLEEAKYYYGTSVTADQLKNDRETIQDEIIEEKKDLLFDAYTFVTKHNDFIPFYGEVAWGSADVTPTDETTGLRSNGTKYVIPKKNYNERFKSYLGYVGNASELGVDEVLAELNKKELDMLKGKKYPKINKYVYGIRSSEGLKNIYDKELFYTNAEGAFLQITGELAGKDIVINAYRVYYNTGQVSMDFNGTRINYPFVIFTSVILMKVMLYSSIGMIMRLYKCTILFLILPGPISMSPLDDGASFKKWQKKFMGTVMAAYSVVIAVNIYLTIARLFLNITLTYTPTNYMAGYGATGVTGILAESMSLLASSKLGGVVLQCIFVIVGGLMVEKFCGDFATLFNVDNPMSEGKGTFNKMMEPLKKAGKLVATAAIIVASVYTGGAAAAAAKGAKAASAAAKAAQAAAKASKGGAKIAQGVQNNSKIANAATKTKAPAKTPANNAPGAQQPQPQTGQQKPPETSQQPKDTNNATSQNNNASQNQNQNQSQNQSQNQNNNNNSQQQETKQDKKQDKKQENQQQEDEHVEDEAPEETPEEEVEDDSQEEQPAPDPTAFDDTDEEDDNYEQSEEDAYKDMPKTGIAGMVDRTKGAAFRAKSGIVNTAGAVKDKTVGAAKGIKNYAGKVKENGIKTVGSDIKSGYKNLKENTTVNALKGKLAKTLGREKETLEQMAKDTIMNNIPGLNLASSIKKGHDNALKDVTKNDITYKKVAENLDKIRQARLDKKAEEAHAHENRYDSKAIFKAMEKGITDGFDSYFSNLEEQFKKDKKTLDSIAQVVKDYEKKGLMDKAREAREYLDAVAGNIMMQHAKEYSIQNGEISLKAQDEIMKARDSILAQIDSLLNSGVTRSEFERAMKILLKDSAAKGHTEAVDIIRRTLGSLRDKF